MLFVNADDDLLGVPHWGPLGGFGLITKRLLIHPPNLNSAHPHLERGRFKSRAWNKNCLSMFSCWSMWKCGDVCILIWTLEPVNLTQHDAHLFGERGWMGIRGLRGSGSEMNALPRGCRWDLLSPSTWPAVKFYFIFSKPRVNLAFIQEIKLKFCWHET